MFSQKIVSSDAFLDMPISTQALYFHLGMTADDDGFVNPKKVMRMIGTSEDDLKVLLTKRFVIAFENGVIVIKHWKINNLIRKDFYQSTIYTEELKLIETKENKAYTECKQIVNNLSPQYRIGKVRKGKNTTPRSAEDDKQIPEFIDLFKTINPTYAIMFGRPNQRQASARLLKLRPLEEWVNVIAFIASRRADQFCPRISTPIQLEQKYAALGNYGASLKSKVEAKKADIAFK